MQSAIVGAVFTSVIALAFLFWSLYSSAKARQNLLFKLKLQQSREQNISQQLDVQRDQNQKLQQRMLSVEQLLHQEQVINAQQGEKISVL